MNRDFLQVVPAPLGLDAWRDRLSRHPLYAAIRDVHDLSIFMEHHVYAVWDFMSLAKALQRHLAPICVPWLPPKNAYHANFINRLVLEEESDDAAFAMQGSAAYASHFDRYLEAMVEVGADIGPVSSFIDAVRKRGFDVAMQVPGVPQPAKQFMAFTFELIADNKAHLLSAALAYGRESLLPELFRSLIEGLQMSRTAAPGLFAYFERHIQLDEQEHGPIAVSVMQDLCENSEEKLVQATRLAERSMSVRMDFWDAIYSALPG